jgi:hypothetical protein
VTIGTITSANQVAPLPSPAATADALEIYEEDGLVMVSSPGGESHPLLDEHCYNCVTGFESLQSAARNGSDGGLFELAVEQTEKRKKALGVIAQPGAGPLPGLTETGAIRETGAADGRASDAGPRRARDAVSLSRSGMLRATGAEVASLSGVRAPIASEDSDQLEAGLDSGATAAAVAGTEIKEVEAPKGVDAELGDDSGKEKRDIFKGAAATLEQDLTDDEKRQVDELQQRDTEVRAHEQAHKAAGGQHAGAISLSYQTGPDGRKYAIGGEVPVDISPVSGDPSATLQKMQTLQRAALAPAEPSSADRQVAARAAQYANEARTELLVEQKEAPKKPAEKTGESGQGDRVDTGAAEGGAGLAKDKASSSDPSGAQADAVKPQGQGAEQGGLAEPLGAQRGAESADAGPTEGTDAAIKADAPVTEAVPTAAQAATVATPSGDGEAGPDFIQGQRPAATRPRRANQMISAYGRSAQVSGYTQPASFNAIA